MTPHDEFADYLTHPRYGRRPRITGLNPQTDHAARIFLHWHSGPDARVPNTAIAADLSRQAPATLPVTHYYDTKRLCRDCARPFLFFAEEQRYWYEELGFPLESDCVRCIDCRKNLQGLDRKRARYEALFHLAERTLEQELEIADCVLSLVEAGAFHPRTLDRVRATLKRLPSKLGSKLAVEVEQIKARVQTLDPR